MISIAIPAYEMGGKGLYYLDRAIKSINHWGVDYEIVIALDHGFMPDFIKEGYDFMLIENITVVRNQRKQGAAGNLNTALDIAKGDIIKVLFQDDTLTAWLQNFANINHWSFCTSKHNTNRGDHVPYHPPSLKELALGCNTYGSPSAMAFRRTDLRFDENLQWLFDVDFYVRMTQRYGLPDLLPTFVNITEWEGMATNTVCTGDIRVREANYMKQKYANL